MAQTYRLAVNQISQTCFFELTWGQGQQLMAQLPYPEQLTVLYQRWQRAYLGYYQSAFGNNEQPMRGRAGVTGQISSKRTDWHSQLVQAEAKFLSEFHRWLRSEPLFPIRRQLGKAATIDPTSPETITLFITCNPIHLSRRVGRSVLSLVSISLFVLPAYRPTFAQQQHPPKNIDVKPEYW